MRRIDEKVEVATDQTGQPVGFLWRSSSYQVSHKPIRWFARREWWLEATRVQRGIGARVLEVEVWRMAASNTDDSAKTTQFEIIHDQDSATEEKGIWRLVRVYD